MYITKRSVLGLYLSAEVICRLEKAVGEWNFSHKHPVATKHVLAARLKEITAQNFVGVIGLGACDVRVYC